MVPVLDLNRLEIAQLRRIMDKAIDGGVERIHLSSHPAVHYGHWLFVDCHYEDEIATHVLDPTGEPAAFDSKDRRIK